MSNSTVPGNSDQIRYHQCEPWCEYRAGSSTPRSTFTVPPEGTGSVNGSALGAVHPGNPRIGPPAARRELFRYPHPHPPGPGVPECQQTPRHASFRGLSSP